MKKYARIKTLVVFGTRPEAIKLAPLIKEMEKDKAFEVVVCNTGQHMEMIQKILKFFDISPDFNLNIMKSNQTLYDITSEVLLHVRKVLNEVKPQLVIIQGDTTTAFTSALAAFYGKYKVAHVEAGLRSYNKYAPFPEEMNRVLIGRLADYHFAPTRRAKLNLIKEGIKKNIWVVGNTAIDALFMGLEIIKREGEKKYRKFFNFLDFSKKIILVTGHRRENFGKPFQEICYALKEIAIKRKDVEIVFPVHLNPNVREPVNRILRDVKNIHLIEPLSYNYLIWLMSKSYLILTDSGGIQEEAPSLGKPVLVMREVTERIEGLEKGVARLVGTQKEKIVNEVFKLLDNKEEYLKMSKAVNPYGDGKASKRILNIIKHVMKKGDSGI